MYKWNGEKFEKQEGQKRPEESLIKARTARKPLDEDNLKEQAKRRERQQA